MVHVTYLPNNFTPPFLTDNSNKNIVVGTTAGSVDVSPTGAATYNIPIILPPGSAGMAPNLSIAYNSQSGNGLLGMGWNLSGLSSITRTGQNFYNDGNITDIDFTSTDDRFTLDGNRLILVDKYGNSLTDMSTYGQPNTFYRTEK